MVSPDRSHTFGPQAQRPKGGLVTESTLHRTPAGRGADPFAEREDEPLLGATPPGSFQARLEQLPFERLVRRSGASEASGEPERLLYEDVVGEWRAHLHRDP